MDIAGFKKRYRFIEEFHTYPGSKGAVFDLHDLEYLKLSFVVHLYWIGPLRQHAAGLLDYCDTVWESIQPSVTHFRDNKKRRNPGKLTTTTFETLRSWLADPDNAPPMMALMDIFNKRFDASAADVRLDFNGLDFRGGGSVNLYLPAEWVEHDPTKYAHLCVELASKFEFCSGLAGFGLSSGEVEGETCARRELYAVGKHHPGVDVRSVMSNGLGQGIKGVNWLTFLHPNFVECLGGREKLGVSLKLPGVDVVDLPSGIMIQAGAAPEIGDTNRGLTCSTYHAVGRVLASIRDHAYPAVIGNESGSYVCPDRTAEWLSRFD